MKKTIVYVLVLGTAACAKPKDVLNPLGGTCQRMIENYTNSLTALTVDGSRKNCEAVIKSLDDLVNKCTFITAEQKREYREARADLSCDDYK